MIELLNPIILISTIILVIVVIIYVSSDKYIPIRLVDKQQVEGGSLILTFLCQKKKIGTSQQLLIKLKKQEKGIQLTPIQVVLGSFKLLISQSMIENLERLEEKKKTVKSLIQLPLNSMAFALITRRKFEYVGNSTIRISANNKKTVQKKFSNIYILASGAKIPIAYEIIKLICQRGQNQKPFITTLFVGAELSQFSLKKQFETLEEQNENIKYFYSIPVKGQRQPSIVGLGISSQKVEQSFESPIEGTFCILCSENSEITVSVERALLKKGVALQNILSY